jgi:hypothetical protein
MVTLAGQGEQLNSSFGMIPARCQERAHRERVDLMSSQQSHAGHAVHSTQIAGIDAMLGVGLHTASMLLTMVLVAWIVYRKLGLMVLKKGWINFDLIWSAALLVVGDTALITAF